MPTLEWIWEREHREPPQGSTYRVLEYHAATMKSASIPKTTAVRTQF